MYSNFQEYLTKAGEKMLDFSRINVYTPTSIYNAPQSPGIYGWYAEVASGNVESYHRIHQNKAYEVRLKSYFGEEYSGKTKRVPKAVPLEPPGSEPLSIIASMVFGTPLYIGISKNLNHRLNTHLNLLSDALNISTEDALTYLKGSEKEIKMNDSDSESKDFGVRLGFFLKEIPFFNISSLRIRTIEMKEGYSWNDLQKVEKFLNRIYLPPYGKK